MRKVSRWAAISGMVVGIALALYASTFVVSYGTLFREADPLLFTDVGGLAPARVEAVHEVRDVAGIRAVLADARARGLKVSIAGSRHSQGGQTYAAGAVVLSMRGFNRIVQIDSVGRTVTVESGATWDEVQRAIAPRGLALKVMQSSNVFTVGGTLSANAHGRDLDVTQIAEVTERFGLMLADGRIVEVSREENSELFSLVIGGYGLYGVILDVTLRVVPDELYEQSAALLDYREFPRYFAQQIQPDSDAVLMIARPSIDPDPDAFMREMVVVTWRRAAPGAEGSHGLTEEEHVIRDRFLLGLSRRFDWAKTLRWRLQKRFEPTLSGVHAISRNNAMRPPLAPVAFLEYRSRSDTDILQEYFVPVDRFVAFMDRSRLIFEESDVNVLSVTVRYVTPDRTSVLAYAPREDMFAVVHLTNVGLDPSDQARAGRVTRELVAAALEVGGTYYLTYQLYPTPAQLRRAYPAADSAFARKRSYDPTELFTSRFYERYGRS